jgi:hypothetical protein
VDSNFPYIFVSDMAIVSSSLTSIKGVIAADGFCGQAAISAHFSSSSFAFWSTTGRLG